MPSYVLDPRTPLSVQPGAVEITLHAAAPTSRCRIEVTDSEGRPLPSAIQPAPTVAIVPVVVGRLSVSVVCETGDFGPGSSAALSLSVERPGLPSDTVQVTGLDVSGLPRAELATITSRDRALVVSAPEEEVALGPLATAARTGTRRILGVTRVGDDASLDVTFAVDASASMRELARSGALEPAIELLVGVAAVIADHTPRVVLVADGVREVAAPDPASLAASVVAALVAGPAVLGMRSAHTALNGLARDGYSLVYLLTDGIPPDLAALEREDAVPGEARHLVVLAAEGFDGGALPIITTHLPLTPAGQPSALPSSVERAARSLLRGCFVPGTALAQAVDR